MSARLLPTSGLGLLCLLAAAGCGGKAVIDGSPPGTAGAGTGGGTSTTTSTSSTSSTSSDTSTTSTSTDPPGGLCQQACDLLAGCDVLSSCTSRCQATAPECSELQQPWLECLVAKLTPTTCMPSEDCHGPFDEWRSCALTWHSISVTVNGEDGSCHSSSGIAGGTGQIFVSTARGTTASVVGAR